MTSISYTAKRNIQSGHSAGLDYSFDIGMQVNSMSETAYGTFKKTITRRSASVVDVIETSFQLQTVPVLINGPEYKNMIEFLSSCLSTEQFAFDRYGTVAVPTTLLLCELLDQNYQEQRIETTNYVTFSFSIRKV